MNEGQDYYNNSLFNETPIKGISISTKSLLSALLNPSKLFLAPPPTNLSRDWRGLAALASIPPELLPAANASSDPTEYVLSYWGKQSLETANIGLLLKYFEQIDRFDVLDDTKILLKADAESFKKYTSTTVAASKHPQNISKSSDENLLTNQDAQLSELGYTNPQLYDAFVLFAEEDIDFASELITRMEAFGFKLCVKDRDLLAGQFEHTAMMRLISERCNRLIVIVSPDFLQSPANVFFMNFAQALGIEQRQRKIVPCLYKSCVLPPQLSYYFLLNYERSGRLWNFWDKLKDSLKVTNQVSQTQRLTITEVDSSVTTTNYISTQSAICESKYSPDKKNHPPIMNGETSISLPSKQSSKSNDSDEIEKIPTFTTDTSLSTPSNNLKSVKDKRKKWYKKILTFNSGALKTKDHDKEKKRRLKKPIPVVAE